MPLIGLVVSLFLYTVPGYAIEFEMPPKRQGPLPECELTPQSVPKPAKVREPDRTAKGKLIFGGGGWDSSFYRDPFVKDLLRKAGPDDRIPVVLSASRTPEAAAGGYAAWQGKFLKNRVPVVPIFTTASPHAEASISSSGSGGASVTYEESRPDINGNRSVLVTTEKAGGGESGSGASVPAHTISTDPDHPSNLKAAREAKLAFVLEGGWPESYDHLAGTKLAQELHEAYRRGATVFASSAGSNEGGAVNTSFLWPRNKEGTPEEKAKNPEMYYRLPSFRPGMGVTRDFGVASHVNDPRLLVARGFGEVKETVETFEGGKRSTKESISTNPYAFMDPIRKLVDAPNTPLDVPIFGVPEKGVLVYEKGIARFDGPTDDYRFYIFDPRYPSTKQCAFYYVKRGMGYDLKAGKVIAGEDRAGSARARNDKPAGSH